MHASPIIHPRLVREFSFLSGYASRIRLGRLLMPMQVMADDSGTPGAARDVVFGGLIGSAEEWLSFSDKWDALLREPPSLPLFKMSHAVNKSGHFYYFTDTQWREKVRKFVRIINDPEFRFTAIHVTVDVADYQEHMRSEYDDRIENLPGHLRRVLGITKTPYFYAFQMYVGMACMELLARGETAPFEMFFDDHKSLGQRAKEWFPVLRMVMWPEARALLPAEPQFKDDKDFLPLQAADIIAWLQRNANAERPTDVSWLEPEFTNLGVSRFCGPVNKASLVRARDMSRARGRPPGADPNILGELYKLLTRPRK